MQKKFRVVINIIFLLAVIFSAGGIPEDVPSDKLLKNENRSHTISSLDIVVMVDISASMDPYFSDVTDFFLDNLLKESLRLGDNFYFLSFSGLAEVQVEALNVEQSSVDNIINKIRLLQPIGLYTDLIHALDFLNSFTSRLDPERPKLILLLTDGVHDPQPGSANDIEPAAVLDKVLAGARAIKRDGWAIHILEVPSANLQAVSLPERPDGKLQLDTGPNQEERSHAYPEVKLTDSPQDPKQSRQPHSYLDVVADEVKTTAIPYEKNNAKVVDELHENITNLRQQTEDTRKDADKSGQSSESLFSWDMAWWHSLWAWFGQIWIGPDSSFSWLILLFIGLLLGIIALFFLLFHIKLPSLQRAFRIGTHFQHKRFTRQEINDGLIEMKVDMQNTNIGFRNIHALAPHGSKTVGGGFSHFLIFLVPFPARIAKIRYDGSTYTFVPLKKDFFPDLSGEIPDCLNKTISARSKKGFPISLCFRRYISPLTEINRFFSEIIDAAKKRAEQNAS